MRLWSSLQPEALGRRATSLCGPAYRTPLPSLAQSFWTMWMQVRAGIPISRHAGYMTKACTCRGPPDACLCTAVLQQQRV